MLAIVLVLCSASLNPCGSSCRTSLNDLWWRVMEDEVASHSTPGKSIEFFSTLSSVPTECGGSQHFVYQKGGAVRRRSSRPRKYLCPLIPESGEKRFIKQRAAAKRAPFDPSVCGRNGQKLTSVEGELRQSHSASLREASKKTDFTCHHRAAFPSSLLQSATLIGREMRRIRLGWTTDYGVLKH